MDNRSSTSRKRSRYTMEVNFGSQEEKEAFLRRLQSVRELYTPDGCPSLDNHGLLNAMFETVEGSTSGCASDTRSDQTEGSCFLSNSGKITVALCVS